MPPAASTKARGGPPTACGWFWSMTKAQFQRPISQLRRHAPHSVRETYVNSILEKRQRS